MLFFKIYNCSINLYLCTVKIIKYGIYLLTLFTVSLLTMKVFNMFLLLQTDWSALSEEYAYDDAVGEPVKLEITVLKVILNSMIDFGRVSLVNLDSQLNLDSTSFLPYLNYWNKKLKTK